MNSTAHDPAVPAATQSSTPGCDAGFAIEAPTPTALKSVTGQGAPTPTPPEHTATSVSGTRPVLSQTAAIIANLQKQDVAAVEAALVSVREAYRRGDHSAIEEALIGQAVLLQALSEKFLRMAGNQSTLRGVEAYTTLSLRALEQARKTLATLGTMRGGPKNQTNVQVNVGAPGPGNEVVEVSHE